MKYNNSDKNPLFSSESTTKTTRFAPEVLVGDQSLCVIASVIVDCTLVDLVVMHSCQSWLVIYVAVLVSAQLSHCVELQIRVSAELGHCSDLKCFLLQSRTHFSHFLLQIRVVPFLVLALIPNFVIWLKPSFYRFQSRSTLKHFLSSDLEIDFYYYYYYG